MAAKRIDDVGRKVSGLRKDRFRSGMSLEQLRDLSPEEAEHHVTKDNVWPVPDYEALVGAGMPPDRAAFVKVARDRMPVKPALGTDPAGFARAREDFVRATGAVRDLLLSDAPLAAFRDGRSLLAGALGFDPNDRSARAAFDGLARQVIKDRWLPLVIQGRDNSKIASMVKAGFPGKVDPWLRTARVVLLSDGWYPASGNRTLVGEAFGTEAEAVEWLKRRHEESSARKKDARKKEPVRPHLDSYVRTGPDRRGGRSVTAEELMEEFGFGGVAFGNWLPDGERQAVIDMGYDSLCDLAEAVGIERRSVGLGGRLVVAFGAMGNGGAAATYHFADPAVNMTRFKGAGSLAHEWGHAFDDWAAEVDRAVRTGVPVFGSGYRERKPDRVKALDNLSPSQAKAWDGLMDALWSRPLAKAEAVERAAAELASNVANMERCKADLARQLAKPYGERNNKWVSDIRKWLPARESFLARKAAELAEMERKPEGADYGKTDSQYLEQAKAIGGKADGYWTRPTEMLARAFESWVHDRIVAGGGYSPYLVHGVEEGTFAGDDFPGNPYPTGSERESFARRFEELLDVMRPLLDRAPAPSPR